MRKSFRYDGKRYWISGKDEAECLIKKTRLLKDLEEGRVLLNKNTTVRRWSEEWLKVYVKDGISKGTFENYRTNLNKHILPIIGDMRVREVLPIHLAKIINRLDGHSRSHLLKVKQLLFRMFEDARHNRMLIENPAETLKIPKTATDGTHRPLTLYETEIALKTAEYHKAGLWVKILYYFGLRPGETAALQALHFDLNARTLTVAKARKARTNEIEEPKTKSGIRTIPIPDAVYEDIKTYISGKSPFDFVFVQETTGKPHTQRSMYYLWRSFKRAMQIEAGCRVYRNELIPPFPIADDLVPYCFRHNYGTELQAAGVPINIAKEWMGHADISTTSNIYTHRSDKAFEASRKLLDEHLPVQKVVQTKT